MNTSNCSLFIKNLPKAELHVHIEGTMEPEQLMYFADRNNISLPSSLLTSEKKYAFHDYASFIQAYLQATVVLNKEQDFYDLTLAYLKKVSQQGVLHVEIFFELQAYLDRGIAPEVIIHGLEAALEQGEKEFGITGFLILCFIRHLDESEALKQLELVKNRYKKIKAVGLAALEEGNPPSKFKRAFDRAREYGYHRVAHVAEAAHDGPAMIREAIGLLGVERIDHGIGCMKDPELVKELSAKKMPLTVCPLSNVILGFCKNMQEHPLKKMLNAGLAASLHSDDPAFFGGYIADNYQAAAKGLSLTCNDLITCSRNSLSASFLDEPLKKILYSKLEAYVDQHTCF